MGYTACARQAAKWIRWASPSRAAARHVSRQRLLGRGGCVRSILGDLGQCLAIAGKWSPSSTSIRSTLSRCGASSSDVLAGLGRHLV